MRLLAILLALWPMSLPVSAQDGDLVGLEEPIVTGSRIAKTRVSLSFGISTDPELVFNASNQGLNTEDRMFAEIDIWFPSDIELFPGWNTYLTGGITFEEMLQRSHFNIPSGAPGPSNGTVTYTAVHGGLGVARPVGRRSEITFDAGLGFATYTVSGSFNGSGSNPFVYFGANFWQQITENIAVGPGLHISYPLGGGATAGGFGLGRESAMRTTASIGMNFTF